MGFFMQGSNRKVSGLPLPKTLMLKYPTQINQEVRKVPAAPTSIGPDGELLQPQDDDGPLAGKKVHIVAVDMSESRMLQLRYNFRCVPMFLCFFGPQLVHASNTMRTKQEFITQVCSSSHCWPV